MINPSQIRLLLKIEIFLNFPTIFSIELALELTSVCFNLTWSVFKLDPYNQLLFYLETRGKRRGEAHTKELVSK